MAILHDMLQPTEVYRRDFSTPHVCENSSGVWGVRTPSSASTSLIIHYSQSTYNSLHDTAQIAPAPSEKTITGAASSRYAFEVDRTREQSVGLRSIRTYYDEGRSRSKPHLPTICASAKITNTCRTPPFH